MTGHLRLLACNGHCAIALLPAQQLLGINSSPIQNGEYRESPVVGVVLESVYIGFGDLIFAKKYQHRYAHNKFLLSRFLFSRMVPGFAKFKSHENYALYGCTFAMSISRPQSLPVRSHHVHSITQ